MAPVRQLVLPMVSGLLLESRLLQSAMILCTQAAFSAHQLVTDRFGDNGGKA